MNAEERTHLEALRDANLKRLRVLEIREAIDGKNTQPEVLIEIEDIRKKIADISGQLRPQTIDVELFSHEEIGASDPERIRLNWVDYFNPTLPSPEIWNGQLLPQLKSLLQALNRKSARLITLRPKAHLSAGYAFGYTFRQPTGFQIWIEQPIPNTDHVQWWRTDEAPVKDKLLRQESLPGVATGTDLTVEVRATNQDVQGPVGHYIQQHQLPIRERILFTLPPNESGRLIVPGGPHALSMAIQIGDAIRELPKPTPDRTIHLFGAMPIGLAVLIGTQLNACEPIQCYEYKRPENVYQPSCRLVP